MDSFRLCRDIYHRRIRSESHTREYLRKPAHKKVQHCTVHVRIFYNTRTRFLTSKPIRYIFKTKNLGSEQHKLTFGQLFTNSQSLSAIFRIGMPFPAFTVAKFEGPAPGRNHQMRINFMVSGQTKIFKLFKRDECTFFFVSQEKRLGCTTYKRQNAQF